MEYVEALDEIERYKYLTVDSICIPDPGCSISFTLRDAITMRDSFLIIITRGQDTIDISLQQKWDFLCKRNDTDSAIITRFDYASQPHKDKGRYHVHIGSDEHGGRTLAMEEVRDILGIENINLQSAILPSDPFYPDDMLHDDVAEAIRGFLLFVSCDYSDVDNLEILW